MKEEILSFINRRWKLDSNWLDGNCYYFALILTNRFKELQIYYLPIEGHFISGNGIEFYDWTGFVDLKEKPYLLDEIKHLDSLWYERLIRDCVL
jgi:hypothetical protein